MALGERLILQCLLQSRNTTGSETSECVMYVQGLGYCDPICWAQIHIAAIQMLSNSAQKLMNILHFYASFSPGPPKWFTSCSTNASCVYK